MEQVVAELQEPIVGSSNLLDLLEPCSWDSDDELLGLGGIKPKSSPIPRRRSSASSSDDDSQPPPSSSRRVSFADAFGLSLVSVKQFDAWSMCDPSDPLEGDLKDVKGYFLKLLFARPLTLEELLYKVQEQKLELESLELLPGTTTLKGIVRVQNLCFDKLVYIRTSLDCWSSHFDLLAEHMPGSTDVDTDCFSFKLTLVPPFGEQGARVDFCIRYETPFGTFWVNNSDQNYVLFCHEKAKEQDENETKHKPKSCLKSTSHDNSSMTSSTSSTEEIPEIILNCGIAAVSEPVGGKGEKIQEEHFKLQEENSRNRSKRGRRKTARMAKLQQYFVQREEKDIQQTEKGAGEVVTKTNMNVPVPAIDEAPLNFSTPQTNVGTEIWDIVSSSCAEPNKIEGQKSTAGSMDADSNQVSTAQTETQEKDNIPIIHSELMTSKSQAKGSLLDSVNSHKSMVDSQALENSQDKETVTGQTVSLKQHLLECQTSDKSVSKTVEKAWEYFEKGAMERMGSTADSRMSGDPNSSGSKTNHGNNALLENNPGTQSYGHHFTFETIVAPLYHQVFERMENERKALNRTPKAVESVGKLEDGSLRVVTYPSHPRTQSVEARPNPGISAKHVNNDVYHGACKETGPQYLLNTKNTTEKALSGTNVKTELVAETALHDTALTDITEDSLDANVSESKTAQGVPPIQKQHLLNSLPFHLECSPNNTLSWEESTLDQTKPTSEMLILQSENSLVSTSEDTEYSLDNKPPHSGYSLDALHQESIPLDCAVLTTQSEVDSTTAKPSLAVVSENPLSMDSSVTQISYETRLSDEITKIHASLNTSIKGQGESHIPIPDSALFHSDISSNVTPNIIQSEASSPCQNLTQATIQTQSPATTSFNHCLQATGTTLLQFQITEGTNLIQDSNNICHDSDDSYVGTETELNSDINNDADSWERMEPERNFHSATETTKAEESHVSPEETVVDNISLNRLDVSQVNENKEHGIAHLHFSDGVMDLNELLGKGITMSKLSSNDNPKDIASSKVSSKDSFKGASQGEEVDIYEENEQVENLDKNKEQELTDMKENQSDEIEEIGEVENQFEEEEQQQEEQEVVQEEQPQQQEYNERVELGNEDKFEDTHLQYTEDNETEADEEDKEEDTEQNGNGVEWQDEKHLSFEAGTEKQEMVGGVTSVATLQNSTNVDSFIREVHLHVRQEYQSACRSLVQESEEPVDERHSINGEEEIFWESGSSQQALTPNSAAAFSDRVEKLKNNSDSINFIDREEEVCCQIDKDRVAEDAIGEVDKLLENFEDLNKQSEDMDDSASTGSLTDDEMELYLLRLKNTQQSGLKDSMSLGKRQSISRTRTIPSPMPSISEYIDEDKPNASLDDLTNEEMMELEKAILPLLDNKEVVIGPNVLWWREFFSSDNMSKMIMYAFLLVVFLIAAYFYDFIACFGLYLLALYWLYFQRQREPLKGT